MTNKVVTGVLGHVPVVMCPGCIYEGRNTPAPYFGDPLERLQFKDLEFFASDPEGACHTR